MVNKQSPDAQIFERQLVRMTARTGGHLLTPDGPYPGARKQQKKPM
jgi:hypothetical protein